MTSISSKLKSLNQKQLWLALIISIAIAAILSHVYAGSLLLNESVLNLVCRVEYKSCSQLRDFILIAIPYLFLIPAFYFTIRLVRTGSKKSKFIAWVALIGQVLLLPLFWLLLYGIALGVGIGQNGGL